MSESIEENEDIGFGSENGYWGREVLNTCLLDRCYTEDRTIKVWQFEDAPAILRDLSTNKGDEDWLALIPPSLADRYIPWLEEGTFGVYSVNDYTLSDGSIVKIGSHA